MIDSSKLMKYAIGYLSKFNSSKANLEKVLKNKIRRLSLEKKDKYLLYNLIEKIIYDLERKNLINDNDYAISKFRNLMLQGKSKNFIKSYLIQKGIDDEIFLKIFTDYEIENSEWEIDSAKIFARKKRFAEKKENKIKNLSKMSRAGFSYEIAKKILDEI